ncbi:MAG: hypothetical protein HRF40_02725 [Nitrososphaera sp.]
MMIRQRRRRRLGQRRIGEIITIASGIGVTVLGASLGVNSVAYAGLCIAGLGVFSIFWR